MGITACRQNRNGRRGGLVSQPPDEFSATHDRHHHVGHHQIGRRLGYHTQRGAAITSIGYLIPGSLEDPPEKDPMNQFVVNNEDLAQLDMPPPHGPLLNVAYFTRKVRLPGTQTRRQAIPLAITRIMTVTMAPIVCPDGRHGQPCRA
jgi:hypothetical protein